MRSYTPVVPSKSTPDSRPKWARCIPVFRPKRCKNPTRWGGTCLYSLYKGVPPPGKHSFVRKAYCTITNEIGFLLARIITLKKRKSPICFKLLSTLSEMDTLGSMCRSQRDVRLVESHGNKGSKERQEPTLDFRCTEVSFI